MDDDIFDAEKIFSDAQGSAAPKLYDNISSLRPSMPWLDELNPEQRQAVETTEGPLLVLSGAGTGKTKVLTTRLAYILTQMKAQPWNCLVVTFTNRAANEMRERVQKLIGDMADSVWLGTFHSICVKILRKHASVVGLKPNFTILGEDDQKRVIKQILEAEGIDDKKYPPQTLMEQIARLKDKGITVDKVENNYRSTVLSGVYQKYQARLIELNAVDFGDILLDTLVIFMSDADILRQYQQKFKYIMVDEYQDTNVTQYLFLRLLSQLNRNLCCVGDDDQSIYSWRGAEIENIMRFQKDFTDAQVIRLERNYRSTANILTAASGLIAHNATRLGKTLRVADNSPAKQTNNEKIKVISLDSGKEEAAWIAKEIEILHRNGYEYSDMAVLVRTAFQTREFEEKFIGEAIPYQVIGGPKFYERAEIRDALAYFRVIMQPADDLALERIINKPTRGVGAKTLEKLRQISRERQMSLSQAVETAVAEDLISGKVKNNLADLSQKFKQWRQIVSNMPLHAFAEQVLNDSGYWDMLKNDSSVEAPARLENLHELLGVMGDEQLYPNLAEFLEHVSLVMENDSAIDRNKVMLMTLHSAKGLEFNVVFLPGWEEELFPHKKSMEEGGSNALEEERRLAYVAITRAKQKLYITTANSRLIYGEWRQMQPSRFFNEISSECLDIHANQSAYYKGGYGSGYSSGYRSYGGYKGGYKKKKTFSTKPSYQRYDEDADEYTYEPDDYADYDSDMSSRTSSLIGVRVYHESFGFGKITAVSGQSCEVNFEKYGRKKVMGTYLRRA